MTGGRPDEQVPGTDGGRPPEEALPDDQGSGTAADPGDPGTTGTAGVPDGREPGGADGEPAGPDGEGDGLDALRQERDEYLDMVRRVQADFENYKKRMVRQQTELLERAAESLVGKLLPVLDAFDLARAHLEDEGSPEGKALVQAAGLLSDTLAKEGLDRVDEVGVTFDPTAHEAVEHQPADATADTEAADGPVVSEVLRAGYRYKGRLLRPAMVRVRG